MPHQALERAIAYRERVLKSVPDAYLALERAITAVPTADAAEPLPGAAAGLSLEIVLPSSGRAGAKPGATFAEPHK